MNVLVTCGLSDNKAYAKLVGLCESAKADRVVLVRKSPIALEKVININPPRWIAQSAVLFEIWRLFTLVRQARLNRVSGIVGIQGQNHGIVAVLVAWLLGLRSAFWLIGSDIFIYSQKPILGLFLRLAIKNCSVLYVMGSSSRRLVYQLTGRTKNILVQNVLNIYGETIERGNVSKEWDLIFAGNLVDVKNPLLFLEIVKNLTSTFSDLRVCIIGEGVLAGKVESTIKAMGLERAVELKGQVGDPLSYIQRARLLVLTSKSEGLPSVLIEAATLGVPVVAPAVGEIPGIGRECEGVFCLNNPHPDNYAKVIGRLLASEQHYNAASRDVSEYALRCSEKWSLESQIRNWEYFLDQ